MRSRSRMVAVAVMALLSMAVPAAAANAPRWMGCASFNGQIVMAPGLPAIGHAARVRPTLTLRNGKLTACRGPSSSAHVTASLTLGRATNCTEFIAHNTAGVETTATGTMHVSWTANKTSTLAVTLRFGAVSGYPSLATLSGSVSAGAAKGTSSSAELNWSLPPTECFGGAPLTRFDLNMLTIQVPATSAR